MEKEELKQELNRITGTFTLIKDKYNETEFGTEVHEAWRKCWDETTIILRKLLVNSHGCKELPEIPEKLNIIWNNSRCAGKDMVVLSLNLLLESIS